jgi:hypothetical protein
MTSGRNLHASALTIRMTVSRTSGLGTSPAEQIRPGVANQRSAAEYADPWHPATAALLPAELYQQFLGHPLRIRCYPPRPINICSVTRSASAPGSRTGSSFRKRRQSLSRVMAVDGSKAVQRMRVPEILIPPFPEILVGPGRL